MPNMAQDGAHCNGTRAAQPCCILIWHCSSTRVAQCTRKARHLSPLARFGSLLSTEGLAATGSRGAYGSGDAPFNTCKLCGEARYCSQVSHHPLPHA